MKPCTGNSDFVPSLFQRSLVLNGVNDQSAKASPQESEYASRYDVETQKKPRNARNSSPGTLPYSWQTPCTCYCESWTQQHVTPILQPAQLVFPLLTKDTASPSKRLNSFQGNFSSLDGSFTINSEPNYLEFVHPFMVTQKEERRDTTLG